MQLYSAKVRLGNSLHNEVVKVDVTVPEIIVLRHVHGTMSDNGVSTVDPASVVDIKQTGENTLSDDQERTRLAACYSVALKKLDTSINQLFGAAGPLPRTTEGLGDQVVKVEGTVERVKRSYNRKTPDVLSPAEQDAAVAA